MISEMNLSLTGGWFALVALVAFCHAARDLSFVHVVGQGGPELDLQEFCAVPCADTVVGGESANNECFEGCRLNLIYRFFDAEQHTTQSLTRKCRQGCVKSYEKMGEESLSNCGIGCTIRGAPKTAGVIRLEINDTAKTFEVANAIIADPLAGFRKVFNQFKFLPIEEIPGNGKEKTKETETSAQQSTEVATESEIDPVEEFFKQFETIRNTMDSRISENREIEEHLKKDLGSLIKVGRPAGHEIDAFNGNVVDNSDDFGHPIIHSFIVDDEDLNSAEFQQRVRETEQLAIRNERLIQIGHYSVKLILAVLFIVILLVALAMVRHHSRMTYHHLHNKAFMAAASTGAASPKGAQALPTKEEGGNVYATAPVHGSPPPAYDQLSIKKVQEEEQQEQPQQQQQQ